MFNYEVKLVDSSRMIADIITADIGNNADKFAELMDLALRDKYPISMRAARVIGLCAEKNISLITPHLQGIVDALAGLHVEGVKRSFLKILAEMPVPLNEHMLGLVTDRAFTWLTDPKEAVAIRYYSIDILLKVARLYPEIKTELTESLNSLCEEDSSALRAKCRNALKHLNTL